MLFMIWRNFYPFGRMCYQLQMLPNQENIISRKSESAISSKIVIIFYIVIRFGECGYLVLTIDHSFGTRFLSPSGDLEIGLV